MKTRRAFSLVELLLAVFILGIGIIGISALFPVGIVQQRQATDDIMGPIVADNAMAILRTKLKPEWFGTYEDFGQVDYVMPPSGASSTVLGGTIPGDWRWKRPGFLFHDVNNTAINELGAIDIFSGLYSSKMDGGSLGNAVNTGKVGNESPDGDAGGGGAALYGMPFNRSLFDAEYSPFDPGVTHPDTVPIVIVTQAERSYPQTGTAGSGYKKPAYFWDCMFRRFDGRIQVAIFVYRIVSGGEPRTYTVAQGAAPVSAATPPLPLSIILTVGNAWTAGGLDANALTAVDNAIVPGTNPVTGNPVDFTVDSTWQYPGQWIVDQYSTVHRVVGGRRNTREGPVILARPIPLATPIPSQVGYGSDGSATTPIPPVRAIWFVPGVDATGTSLVPVYATVQEL